MPPAPRVLVAGAGAANLKGAVALNLAAALAAAGTPARLCDLDGASSAALAALGSGPAPGAERAWTVRLPWAAADLAVVAPGTGVGPEAGAAVEVVDPPPRFDAAVRALAGAAALVLVPVDASPLALRVLGEIAPVVAAGGGRLRVVLARRLPRAADRWALVDALDALAPDALAPDALSPVTLPMARGAGRTGVPPLYAPGTLAARAYARLAAEVAGLVLQRRPTG